MLFEELKPDVLGKMPKCILMNITKEVYEDFDIKHVKQNFSCETIRSRIKRKNIISISNY